MVSQLAVEQQERAMHPSGGSEAQRFVLLGKRQDHDR
jgi:hypothetical protein